MAIRQTYKLPDTATVAGFKDWASDVGAGMVAAGWQQTTDTGQVNWTTFNPSQPLAQNGTFGYEIFKSTDALSSTCPIYVKFFYSTRNYSTSPNNSPMIYVAVGTGSDGYGNLTAMSTGTMGSNGGIAGFNGSSAVTLRVEQNMSWYGSGGSFALALFGHQGYQVNAAQVLVVERSHDSSGNDTDEYFTVVFYSFNYSMMTSYFKPVATGSGGGYTQWISNQGSFILPDGGSSSYAVGSAAWSPCFPHPGRVGYPMRMLAGFKAGDVGDNTIVQTQIYGVTQNYLTFRQANHLTAMLPGGSNQQANSNSNYATIGLRWDEAA